jgi:isoaspartyl peptidase/L-asparaginase-like protein (Ntn-hydrolase superfamily)
MIPAAIATWIFGRRATAGAWKVLAQGGLALDAVEAGCNVLELDPRDCDRSVGFGGYPNAKGEVTLDALIMDGKTHRAGAVACLHRIKRAASVARAVMEKTPHTMLVGEDATAFARQTGFPEEPFEPVEGAGPGHDTLGIVSIDRNGDLAVACTTSGLKGKLPGRVGDSPIIGAGGYVDNAVGAASATGDGDIMMRFVLSFHAVELMRQGLEPAQACRQVLARITERGLDPQAAVIAINKQGVMGAAKIGVKPFQYAIRTAQDDRVIEIP